jgi:hypothetical protein
MTVYLINIFPLYIISMKHLPFVLGKIGYITTDYFQPYRYKLHQQIQLSKLQTISLYLSLYISSMKQAFDDLIQLSKLQTISLQVTSPDSISLQFMPFFYFPVGSYIGFDSLSSHFHSQTSGFGPTYVSAWNYDFSVFGCNYVLHIYVLRFLYLPRCLWHFP